MRRTASFLFAGQSIFLFLSGARIAPANAAEKFVPFSQFSSPLVGPQKITAALGEGALLRLSRSFPAYRGLTIPNDERGRENLDAALSQVVACISKDLAAFTKDIPGTLALTEINELRRQSVDAWLVAAEFFHDDDGRLEAIERARFAADEAFIARAAALANDFDGAGSGGEVRGRLRFMKISDDFMIIVKKTPNAKHEAALIERGHLFGLDTPSS